MISLAKAIGLGFFFSTAIIAEYGCMDTSYHTAQLNDPKRCYFVTGADGGPCSCPCSKYCTEYGCLLARGRCPVCGHYRVPRPYIIISASKESHELLPKSAIDRYKMPILRKRPSSKQAPQKQPLTH